jgi:hypothetical protein
MDINAKFSNDKLLSKESLLLQSLYTYYQEDDNIDNMIPIVTGNALVSLRVLDWFVTNYSKNYDVNFMIKTNGENIKFNVYQDYKNKLKSYNKRFFDPFCRQNKKNLTNKIAFKYNEDKYIVTTIGQLNFFRWAIRNNIIKYVEEHLELINNHMNKKLVDHKKRYKIKDTFDITEKNVQRYNINTTIDFGSNITNSNINNLSLKLNAMGIEDSKYKITKLDFSK